MKFNLTIANSIQIHIKYKTKNDLKSILYLFRFF